MCLAVPARLTRCTDEHTAIADLHGNRVEVSTQLVPDARDGDWVLIHAGFAIQQLDEREAEETWSVLEDLVASDSSPLEGRGWVRGESAKASNDSKDSRGDVRQDPHPSPLPSRERGQEQADE